jgi:hypothetical protein
MYFYVFIILLTTKQVKNVSILATSYPDPVPSVRIWLRIRTKRSKSYQIRIRYTEFDFILFLVKWYRGISLGQTTRTSIPHNPSSLFYWKHRNECSAPILRLLDHVWILWRAGGGGGIKKEKNFSCSALFVELMDDIIYWITENSSYSYLKGNQKCLSSRFFFKDNIRKKTNANQYIFFQEGKNKVEAY